MNYQTAYNKIIDAYFKDEIKPFEAKFCFCGTLCDNSSKWFRSYVNMSGVRRHKDFGDYSGNDYYRMEQVLLNNVSCTQGTPRYEASLFAGMSAALDVLKQIHIERGEAIDEVPVFVKRELV